MACNLGSHSYSRFEPGVGPVFMSYVGCSGRETSILECYYRQPFQYSHCGHSIDAGVICEGIMISHGDIIIDSVEQVLVKVEQYDW